MVTSSWYPISAMTRTKKEILVRWGWMQPFRALLAEDKPVRKWAMLRKNKDASVQVVWLPPKSQRIWRETWAGEAATVTQDWLAQRGWGPEPEAWRPIGDWPDPLPDPLPSATISDTPRMVSIGSVAFDATIAAAEMEDERDRARRSKHEPREPVTLAWWRDASRIRYQPAGEVTRDMAEGRVMRAVSWCGAGQDLSRGSLAMSRFLAEMGAMTLSAALAAQERLADAHVRFEPLTQDHDDFLIAMGWFTRLDPPIDRPLWDLSQDQQVLSWRSRTIPMSFSDIGRQYGISGSRAQQIYQSAIDKVARIANAKSEVDWSIVRLQERNRAAKRASA